MTKAQATLDTHSPANMRGVTAPDGSSFARFERAALSLFTQQSIDSVTTKQIAATAGLSEGLIYRYAKSKMALAENMFFAMHHRLTILIVNAGKTQSDITQKVHDIVKAYIQCADDDWDLFSYHLLNTHRFLQFQETNDDPISAIEGILQDAIERKEIASEDVSLLAAMALGIVLQPALHKAYGRLTHDLTHYTPILITSILNILEARETACPKLT